MTSSEREEFFIGYASPLPPRLRRFGTSVVAVLAAGLLLWAALIVSGHVALDAGAFAFGHPTRFSGTVVEYSYPALRLDGDKGKSSPIPLLVAIGKHGADALIRGLDGRHVTVTGTPIERGGRLMIEIDTIEPIAPEQEDVAVQARPVETSNTAPVELTGEIVDSKCFLGVMVPGSGKTHKECAALCIRGGIPPALFVRDRRGKSALILMTGVNGESVAAEATPAAGEPTTVAGTVHRDNGWLILRTDPHSWRRLSR